MKKRNLAVIALLMFALMLPLAGTLAYFTQSETAHNVITTGNVDIKLEEFSENEEGELVPFENVSGMMPGQSASKIVQVKNTGSGDTWVRIKLDPRFTLDKDYAEPGFAPDVADVIPEINEKDWQFKEGYWYYNKVLKPGDTTEPLLKSVKFAEKMGNNYQGSEFALDVVAEAVQAKNNGENVLEAVGWPKA